MVWWRSVLMNRQPKAIKHVQSYDWCVCMLTHGLYREEHKAYLHVGTTSTKSYQVLQTHLSLIFFTVDITTIPKIQRATKLRRWKDRKIRPLMWLIILVIVILANRFFLYRGGNLYFPWYCSSLLFMIQDSCKYYKMNREQRLGNISQMTTIVSDFGAVCSRIFALSLYHCICVFS